MGNHLCEWCQRTDIVRQGLLFGQASSQVVTLTFQNGHIWQFPHVGLLHYVTAHQYQPPPEFVHDVLHEEVLHSENVYHKGTPPAATEVGFLRYPDLPTGPVPADFVNTLHGHIVIATFRGPFGAVTQHRSIQ